MSKYIIYFCAILLMILSTGSSDAGVNVNINIGDQSHRDYYESISDFYRVSEEDLYYMRSRGIRDDYIPVILQIASSANVSPLTVAKRYGPGVSLLELTRIFGKSPEIYYVPVKVKVDGPPYGKAYGYYRTRARKEWKNIYLDDYDIINLSNLGFMSRYYDVEPDIIIKKRSSGRNFIVINDDFHRNKKSKDVNGSYEYHDNNGSGKKNHRDNISGNHKNNDQGKGKSDSDVKGKGKAKGHNKSD